MPAQSKALWADIKAQKFMAALIAGAQNAISPTAPTKKAACFLPMKLLRWRQGIALANSASRSQFSEMRSMKSTNLTPMQQFFVNCFYAFGWYCLALAISSTIILLSIGDPIGFNLRALVEFGFQFVPLALVVGSAYAMWRNSKITPFLILGTALYYSWISWESLKEQEAMTEGSLLTNLAFTVIIWFYTVFFILLAIRKPTQVGLKQNDL
jgi:hypothetical protein